MDVETVQLTVPCPVCAAPAAAIARVGDGEARWSCVTCRVVGTLPVRVAPVVLPPFARRPIASA